MLKYFYMENLICYLPMVVRLLDLEKNHLWPRENDGELLCSKVLYLSVIELLMYLVNYTRPYMSFAFNLLSTYNYVSQYKCLKIYFRCVITT